MEKFALLYIGGKIPDDLVEENNVAWADWLDMLKDKDALVDAGAPFAMAGKVISEVDSVREYDDRVDSGVSGYTIIKAEDMDTAIDLAMSCPQLPEEYGSGSIEIRHLSEMM